MKNCTSVLLSLLISGSLILGCGHTGDKPTEGLAGPGGPTLADTKLVHGNAYDYFGDSVLNPEKAIAVGTLVENLKPNSRLSAKIAGTISGSCQNKGCWVSVKMADGKDLHVTFKDYGFFVPVKDLTGKQIVLDGEAYWDSTSVETLREEAKEEHKSKKELAAITEPLVTIAFEASGAAIKK